MPGRSAPAQLKLLTGRAPGRDSGGREVPETPVFERAKALSAPKWLGPYGRKEWRRVVPQLGQLGMLKRIDSSSLATYCQMVEVFILSSLDVQETGLNITRITTSKDGMVTETTVPNPSVATQRGAAALIRSWATEFGLTPRAEVGLGWGKDDDGPSSNPFA